MFIIIAIHYDTINIELKYNILFIMSENPQTKIITPNELEISHNSL